MIFYLSFAAFGGEFDIYHLYMPAKIFPVYLFLGEEGFLKHEAIDKLKAKILPPATIGLNYSVFYAKDKNFQFNAMLDSLNTMPFLSEKRLIILKDADCLTNDLKVSVIRYLDKPKDSSVFIMEDSASKIKGKFLLEASERSHLVYFKRLEASDIDTWISKMVSFYGKKISLDAISVIKSSLPNDRAILSSNIEQITLYVGDRQAITKQDVETVTGKSPVHTAFDLIGNIERKNVKKALNVIAALKKDKKKETEIIGLLAWNTRMLLRVKEFGQVKNRVEMCRDFGMNPTMCDQIIRHAANFNKGQILALLNEILASDVAIKTGSDAGNVMEQLVVKMCM